MFFMVGFLFLSFVHTGHDCGKDFYIEAAVPAARWVCGEGARLET